MANRGGLDAHREARQHDQNVNDSRAARGQGHVPDRVERAEDDSLERERPGHGRRPFFLLLVSLHDQGADGSAREEPRQGEDGPQHGQELTLGESQPQQHRVPGHHRREHVTEPEVADRVDAPRGPGEHEEHGVPSQKTQSDVCPRVLGAYPGGAQNGSLRVTCLSHSKNSGM